MAKFINIFALSIYRDRLELPAEYKKQLTDLILEMEHPQAEKPSHSAWLGDTQGHEFLFQRAEFAELHRLIAKKVKEYTHSLGINNDILSFYFQRSWATVTRKGERISEHCHEQSNISFAFYLKKPEGSGGINFITYNHPNEFSPGIFTPSKEELGFISKPSLQTWNNVSLDPAEGEIVIFPSKALHATAPNPTEQPRISISADVTVMLKDSTGHETMMPHFSNWRSFDE